MPKRDFLIASKIFLKGILRNCSLYLCYVFHWMQLAIAISRYKTDKKATPVVLCMANPTSIGGTELQIQIIAEALKTRLDNCLVLISGELEEGKSNFFFNHLRSLHIPVLRLKSLGLVPYDQWPLLTKVTAYLLKKVTKTAKICHFFNPSSTLLAPVMKTMGLAIYYMETGMPTSESDWWKPLHKTIRYFNYVSSVSLAGLRRLELYYGYKGPSCIAPSMFNIPSRPFLCRKPIPDVFDLVYFGRMTQSKGVDLLIEAFSRLLKDFPNAKLSLVGSGKRVPQLQKHVEELGIADRVQFTGWLQNDALFSHLITSDLFCLPSFSEGLPCSILEAMSIGLPIIATNVGGIPEIIEHNVSGILIPPCDKEALTKALVDLACDPPRRIQLREEGILRWKKVGAQEVVMNQLIAAYRMTSL